MALDIQHVFKQVAYLSDDPDTQTAAIIVRNGKVIARGANQLPHGVAKTPERLQRPAKYRYLIHAEADAIADAAKTGVSIDETDVYLNWFPCSTCAKSIVQAGIARLHCDREAYEARKRDPRYEFFEAMEILTEGGVEVLWMEKAGE